MRESNISKDIQETFVPAGIADTRSRALISALLEEMKVLPIDGLKLTDVETVSSDSLEHLIDEAQIRDWITSDMDGTALRRLVASAPEIHKYRGTLWAIRKALANLGHRDIQILEGLDADMHNGTVLRNGAYFYGNDGLHWALYRIYLHNPITIRQAQQIKKILTKVAPARCQLAGLHYSEAQHLHNGGISYNNTYTHGVA